MTILPCATRARCSLLVRSYERRRRQRTPQRKYSTRPFDRSTGMWVGPVADRSLKTVIENSHRKQSSKTVIRSDRCGYQHMYPHRSRNVPDALELLTNDHREIDALFERYGSEPDDQSAHQIFERLALHSAMEHLVLYPEVRRLVDGGDDLIDRAEAEHSAVQELTALALATPPADLHPLVNELAKQVKAHVEFEETQMFPSTAESGADLEHLADAM